MTQRLDLDGHQARIRCEFTMRAILNAPTKVILSAKGKDGSVRDDVDGMSCAEKLCG